jgi:3-oxoacyl-[acyl-carrier protein] reductase
MKLTDKVAIVVGGGSVIGRASATLMAREGARVMIADLSIERANDVAENIKAMGCEAATIRMDMRKAGSDHMSGQNIIFGTPAGS